MMKRKFNVLNLETKLKLLNDVDKNIGRIKDIAKKYGIPCNSVSTIIKNRQQVERALTECSFQPDRKRLRVSKTATVDKALLQWVKRANEAGAIITGPILREKAEYLAKTLDLSTEFKATAGWMERFKRRYGLVYKNNGTTVGYHIADGRTTTGSVINFEEDMSNFGETVHTETCKKLKRKFTVLSLETKIKMLEDVDNKIGPRKEIARKYGIPCNSLSSIIKNRQQVENALSECSFQPHRKRMRMSRTADVDKALIQWVKKAFAAGVYINGPLLRQQAEVLAKTIDTDFKATSGWLERFKRRHGLIHQTNGTKGGCYIVANNSIPSSGSVIKSEEDIEDMDEKGKAACLRDRDSPSWVPTLHLVPKTAGIGHDANISQTEDEPTSSVSLAPMDTSAGDFGTADSNQMQIEDDMSVKIKEEPMDPEFNDSEIDSSCKSGLRVQFGDSTQSLLKNGSDIIPEPYIGRGKKRDFYGSFAEEVSQVYEQKVLKQQEPENQAPSNDTSKLINSIRNGESDTQEHKWKSNREDPFHIKTSHGFTKLELNQALMELQSLSKKQLELLVCVMGREICRLQDSVQYLSSVVKSTSEDYQNIFSELETAERNWEDVFLNEKLSCVGMSLVEDVASGTLELVHLPTERIIFQRQQFFRDSGAKSCDKNPCSLEIESATDTVSSPYITSDTANSLMNVESSPQPTTHIQFSKESHRRKKTVPLRCVSSQEEDLTESTAESEGSSNIKTKVSTPNKMQEPINSPSPTEVHESTAAATKDMNLNPTELLQQISVKKEETKSELEKTNQNRMKEKSDLQPPEHDDQRSSKSENNVHPGKGPSWKKEMAKEVSFSQAETVSIKKEVVSDDDDDPVVESVSKRHEEAGDIKNEELQHSNQKS